MSQNITTKTITSDTLRTVRSHARIAQALVLALQDFSDDKTLNDRTKERAKSASANIGAQMLKLKNALPSEPNQLRMHVESIKQKVEAIVATMERNDTFANHCMRSAITKSANAALESCKTFVAEYKELKAVLAATAKAA